MITVTPIRGRVERRQFVDFPYTFYRGTPHWVPQPRIMERAFHLAQSGRPGPVLVSIPMDFLSADLPVDAFHQTPAAMARPSIDPAAAETIVELLVYTELLDFQT